MESVNFVFVIEAWFACIFLVLSKRDFIWYLNLRILTAMQLADNAVVCPMSYSILYEMGELTFQFLLLTEATIV